MSSEQSSKRTGGGDRPYMVPPPPRVPAPSSYFSRPEPPPLKRFGSPAVIAKVPTVTRVDDRGGSRSGVIEVAAPVPAPAVAVAATPVPAPAPVMDAAPAPVPDAAPVVDAAPAVAAAPAPVSIADSTPMIVRDEPLPSSVATQEVPVVAAVAAAPRPRPVAVRPLRQRFALGLAAAASLLLAVGLAASPDASTRTEQEPAREGLSLAAGLAAPMALPLAWTSPWAPREAVEPSSSSPSPTTDVELTALDDERLALAVVGPIEAVEPERAPASRSTIEPTSRSTPKRSRRPHHRAPAPRVDLTESTPAPTYEPRRTASPRRRPVSTDELLFDGEVALALGDAREAYRLAKRGRDTGAREDAASLVARSACRIGEVGEAKRALRDLPLLERGSVRRDCRRSGSRIGL